MEKEITGLVPEEAIKEENQSDPLYISFHGRVLEHLGIQMYQSPVNALAEFVSNAWDAEANELKIVLPDALSEGAQIIVEDDGLGMTREECKRRFLNVGYARRGVDPDERSPNLKRSILGRKGIGKFAGFGIADVIRIDTISAETAERTVFELDLKDLMGQEYIGAGKKSVKEVKEPLSPGDRTKGTVITLSSLKLKHKIRSDFPLCLARRFLLLERQGEFLVKVNGERLPDSLSLGGIQYAFPRDYAADKKPSGLSSIDSETGWGEEELPNGRKLKWRFIFYPNPVEEEELRGIGIFAKGKLVQTPFFFQLTGGLGGQHGIEYLTGQVEADYLDLLPEDLTATERQRINWDHDEAEVLLKWGQSRVKQLIVIWRELRGAEKRKKLEEKIYKFSVRLEKLPSREARTVRKALEKLGSIETLRDEQFEDLGTSLLTTWEQGRLRELISDLATVDQLSEQKLVEILVEEGVLSALNIAEAVKTKIMIVGGLKQRIRDREIENAVRDYIADNPWIISPELQTCLVEKSLKKVLEQAAGKYFIPAGKGGKRIDLALSHGNRLVLLEFMQPGLSLDVDHLSRFEFYFRAIKTNIGANTAGRFKFLTGYIVADALGNDPVTLDKIRAMAGEEMFAMDWPTLLDKASAGWTEFLQALASREPQDERLRILLEDFQS
jgi:hypothetical protein